VPTLVVVGEDDAEFRAAGDYMATKIPDARLAVIPAAGHSPNLDQPDAFEAAVRSFLHERQASGHVPATRRSSADR
jgi:pimeloyl-ACP methyl ester carboxylesterase